MQGMIMTDTQTARVTQPRLTGARLSSETNHLRAHPLPLESASCDGREGGSRLSEQRTGLRCHLSVLTGFRDSQLGHNAIWGLFTQAREVSESSAVREQAHTQTREGTGSRWAELFWVKPQVWGSVYSGGVKAYQLNKRERWGRGTSTSALTKEFFQC